MKPLLLALALIVGSIIVTGCKEEDTAQASAPAKETTAQEATVQVQDSTRIQVVEKIYVTDGKAVNVELIIIRDKGSTKEYLVVIPQTGNAISVTELGEAKGE